LKALLDAKFANGRELTVEVTDAKGQKRSFQARVRIDTPQEILYYQNGGILQYVLRQLAAN
jgi:aconitate hydratase